MKILRLRFLNLHSLVGEWSIDFADGPLADSGLFAITGATGAGKTTVLDAITLALFGKVARYGKDNPDHVMSRHTGECWAEVEFECAKGIYRSRWQRHRAGKKADGGFQPPKRSVASLPDEIIIAEKQGDCESKIVELTGLDRDRFLRSVLLAQGEFAAFLKAPAKERTELLERVTGTRDYSEISRRAYEAKTQAERAWNELAQTSANICLLSDEARQQLLQEQQAGKTVLAKEQEETSALQARIKQGEALRALEQESTKLAEEQQGLEIQREQLTPKRIQLESHEAASGHQKELQQLASLKQDNAENSVALKKATDALPQLQAAATQAETASAKAHKVTTELLIELQRMQPVWQEVTKLDAVIHAKEQEWKTATESAAKATAALTESTKALEKAQAASIDAEKSVAELQAWLKQHAGDEALAQSLPDLQAWILQWNQKADAWKTQNKKIQTEESQQKKRAERITELHSTVDASALQVKSAQDLVELRTAELTKLLQGKTPEAWELAALESRERLAIWKEQERLRLERGNDRDMLRATQSKLDALAKSHAEWTSTRPHLEKAVELAKSLLEANRRAEESATLVQSLTEHRANLVDGEPCPLCGAAEHPFAGNEKPSQTVETSRELRKKAESQLAKEEKALVQLEQNLATNVTEQKTIQAQRTAAQPLIDEREARWKTNCGTLGMNPDVSEAEFSIRAQRATEADSTISKGLLAIRKAEDESRKASQVLEQVDKISTAKKAELDQERALEKQNLDLLQVMREELDALRKDGATIAEKAKETFAKFGMMPAAAAQGEVDLKTLQQRATTFQLKRDAHREALGTVKTCLATLTERQQSKSAATGAAESAAAVVAGLVDVIQKLKGQRRELFGELSVAEATTALNDKIKAAEAQRAAHRQHLEVALNAVQQLTFAVGTHQQTLAKLEKEIQVLSDALQNAAATLGFASIEALRAAVLTLETAAELRGALKQFEMLQHTLAERQKANDAARAALPPEAAMSADALDALQAALQDRLAAAEEILKSLAVIDHKLEEHEKAKAAQAAMAGPIEAAHREFLRWAKLSSLIGSANGQAFAQFAQSLTLDRLVSFANQHLKLLNPRYSIRRSEERDELLEMEIVDHFQAESVRPMASLSGGETFLASLALALGLSELASGGSRLDSLFIDEGFGSLDSDTIEVALTALDRLRASGKCIGIISHVETIKERITTQIQVTRLASGTSRLEIVS